ncbi:MAG: VanZ family protein [Phenylobacterium sp.]|nr:MAG: VanZ family protein [Phenylobacterium sp.]
MGFHRLPLPVRLALYGLAVAILLYLTLAPSQALPTVNVWDKAEHAIAWAVLTATGLILFPRRPWTIVLFSLALGGLVELLQAVMPLGRDGDWKDWVADSAGVAAVFAVYRLIFQGNRWRTRHDSNV